jgi:hypothetical protein
MWTAILIGLLSINGILAAQEPYCVSLDKEQKVQVQNTATGENATLPIITLARQETQMQNVSEDLQTGYPPTASFISNWTKATKVKALEVTEDPSVSICRGGYLRDRSVVLNSFNLRGLEHAYYPVQDPEISCFLERFCRGKPHGSYCVSGKELGDPSRCLPSVMVECPSGIVGICRRGTFCVDGVSENRVMGHPGCRHECWNISDALCVPIFRLNETMENDLVVATNISAISKGGFDSSNLTGNVSIAGDALDADSGTITNLNTDAQLLNERILPTCQHKLSPCYKNRRCLRDLREECTKTLIVSPNCPCTIVTITPTITVSPTFSEPPVTTLLFPEPQRFASVPTSSV